VSTPVPSCRRSQPRASARCAGGARDHQVGIGSPIWPGQRQAQIDGREVLVDQEDHRDAFRGANGQALQRRRSCLSVVEHVRAGLQIGQDLQQAVVARPALEVIGWTTQQPPFRDRVMARLEVVDRVPVDRGVNPAR